VSVGSELDRQVARVHGTTIPLQPETRTLLPHTIFCQRIGPQIVPLLTYPVAAFAHWPSLPPTERMSWLPSYGQGQPGKESVDSGCMLNTLKQPGFSSLYHTYYWCFRSVYQATKKRLSPSDYWSHEVSSSGIPLRVQDLSTYLPDFIDLMF
jgi:hypothetical protein